MVFWCYGPQYEFWIEINHYDQDKRNLILSNSMKVFKMFLLLYYILEIKNCCDRSSGLQYEFWIDINHFMNKNKSKEKMNIIKFNIKFIYNVLDFILYFCIKNNDDVSYDQELF